MKWMTMLLHLIQQIYGGLKSAQKEKKNLLHMGHMPDLATKNQFIE